MADADPRRDWSPDDFGIGSLFWAIRDAVIVANAKTEQIVLWNDAATGIFGYTPDEALEIPLHALVPDALRGKHREGLARYQELGHGDLIDGDAAVELPGLKRNGTEVIVELRLTPIEEMIDGARFAMAVIRDVSDRKSAERARLRLLEAELRERDAASQREAYVENLVRAKTAIEAGDLEKATSIINRALEEDGLADEGLIADEEFSVE